MQRKSAREGHYSCFFRTPVHPLVRSEGLFLKPSTTFLTFLPTKSRLLLAMRPPLCYSIFCWPAWRNWQTRRTQNPVMVTSYRFDPDRRYHTRLWRNWQTRTVEGRVPQGVRVQVPSTAPYYSTVVDTINSSWFTADFLFANTDVEGFFWFGFEKTCTPDLAVFAPKAVR